MGFFLVLAVVNVAGAHAALPRVDALTVATYNVENYTLADRASGGVYRRDYPKPEADKAALRRVIHEINADVLALQEVGGSPYLLELQRDLKSEGLNYEYSVVMKAADEARMTAVLSKRPFARITQHGDLSFKYFEGVSLVKRGLLEVSVASAAGDVGIFVVHFKSRYTERTDDPGAATQRAGEAVAVRDRILKMYPEPATSRFLIVGDFNDGRASRPVRALMERGRTKISEWLPAADERGHVWTHFFKKEESYSRVDHVLVSPGLAPCVEGGRARIHDSPSVGEASDHRPVVLVIE